MIEKNSFDSIFESTLDVDVEDYQIGPLGTKLWTYEVRTCLAIGAISREEVGLLHQCLDLDNMQKFIDRMTQKPPVELYVAGGFDQPAGSNNFQALTKMIAPLEDQEKVFLVYKNMNPWNIDPDWKDSLKKTKFVADRKFGLRMVITAEGELKIADETTRVLKNKTQDTEFLTMARVRQHLSETAKKEAILISDKT